MVTIYLVKKTNPRIYNINEGVYRKPLIMENGKRYVRKLKYVIIIYKHGENGRNNDSRQIGKLNENKCEKAATTNGKASNREEEKLDDK